MMDQNNKHPVCLKCGAWAECKSPKMDGEGPDTPEVLFVGEAPGGDEDTEGRPFVGKAGGILRDCIEQLKLTSYRLTNTVRCRPPGNKLRGTEPDFCKKFLYEEILRTKPKIIVTLGNVPLKTITGMTGIMSLHGELQTYILGNEDYDPIVLPVMHPASTFYGDDKEEKLEAIVQDLNMIPLLLKDEKKIDEHHLIVRSLEDLVKVTAACQNTDRVAVDTETTGLNPYQGAEVICVTVSWAPGEGALISLDSDSFDRELCLRYLKKILMSPVPKYFHNARFDVEMIETSLKIPIVNLYGDTMIAQFLTDETLKRGLKYLTGRYLRIYRYDQPIAEWFKQNPKAKHSGMKLVPKELLYPYACKDADYTRRLSYIKEEELKSLGMTDLYFKQLMPMVRACIDMREAGIKIDQNRLNLLNDEYQTEISKIDAELNNLEEAKQLCANGGLSENDYIIAAKKPKPLPKFLLSSPSQVATLLFDYLHLEELEGRSTNKHVLFELAKTNHVAGRILEYRKLYKMYSSFIVPMYDLIDRDGFARPEVLPDGTRSGRTSCRNPNLQQSPWDSRVRGIYRTRFEKGQLALIDYSQIELRVMAMLSGDETMSRFYTEKDPATGKAFDFHKETAAIIYRVPKDQVEDWQRRFIKTVNFGVAYGRGAEAIAVQFDLEVEYVREVIKNWWGRFPKLRDWRDATHKFVREHGFVRTPYARRRLLPGIFSSDSKTISGSLNASVNTIIQGTASDICAEVMCKLAAYRREHNCRFKIIMIIHDSIMFDVPEDELHLIEEVFVPVMQTSVRYPWMRDIPLDVSVKVAENWGDMEAMKMRMEGEGQQDRVLESVFDGEEEEEDNNEGT